MLLLTTSCGNKTEIFLKDKKSSVSKYEKDRFYLYVGSDYVGSEDILTRYQVVRAVNLYDIVPELDSLDIESDSFYLIIDRLKENSIDVPYNYGAIIKSDDCFAPIGYCKAYILKKVKK